MLPPCTVSPLTQQPEPVSGTADAPSSTLCVHSVAAAVQNFPVASWLSSVLLRVT